MSRWRERVRALKTEAYALTIACRDPRLPWYVKAFTAFVVAHTFSPIDLIPDFIPVLGYLDDLVVTPLGIALALRMIPAPVMADARLQAREAMEREKPVSRAGACIVVAFWLVAAVAIVRAVTEIF